MVISLGEYKKSLKNIEHKKPKVARFMKHNVPKDRVNGLGNSICRKCGKKGMGVINKYGLSYCRRCFRDTAKALGFKKYN